MAIAVDLERNPADRVLLTQGDADMDEASARAQMVEWHARLLSRQVNADGEEVADSTLLETLRDDADADDGELTRTRKVRRRIIAEKYGTLIDALYSDQKHVEVESQVTFEDGSTGSLHADLKIYDLPGVKSTDGPLAAAS